MHRTEALPLYQSLPVRWDISRKEEKVYYFEHICALGDENVLQLFTEVDCPNKKKAIFKNNIEVVNLETSYQCNRKCDYCPVVSSDRQNKQNIIRKPMSPLFIPNIPDNNRIVITWTTILIRLISLVLIKKNLYSFLINLCSLIEINQKYEEK